LHKNKKHLRQTKAVFPGQRDVVKLLDCVIGDVTQGAAEERRNPRDLNAAVLCEKVFQDVERAVGGQSFHAAVFYDLNLAAAGLENPVRACPEKGIPRPALAALDAFQKKSVGILIQALEKGQGSL